jgi:hypothetical protein
LEAAQKAGNDFLMYTHQHGEKLDKLLAILDKIPDTKEAADRREKLKQTLDSMNPKMAASTLPHFERIKTDFYLDETVASDKPKSDKDKGSPYSVL